MGMPYPSGNNFGVQPDGTTPGANGTAYADAVTALATQWAAFWTLAAPIIKSLDNGQAAM
jgi:flagellar motor protein MotB